MPNPFASDLDFFAKQNARRNAEEVRKAREHVAAASKAEIQARIAANKARAEKLGMPERRYKPQFPLSMS